MTFVEEIASEVADRLEWALGAEARNVEQILRRSFARGDEAPLRALVRKVIVEARRVEPTIARRRMLATSREMRSNVPGETQIRT